MILISIFLIWAIGAGISGAILQTSFIISGEPKNKQERDKLLALGVFFSWITVIITIQKIISAVIREIKFRKEKLQDLIRLEQTINDYWVPATKYGIQFDMYPVLPIKKSMLCQKYHKRPDCPGCPLTNHKLGCYTTQFYKNYCENDCENEKEEGRKHHAMIMGKLFSHIYDQEKSKYKQNTK